MSPDYFKEGFCIVAIHGVPWRGRTYLPVEQDDSVIKKSIGLESKRTTKPSQTNLYSCPLESDLHVILTNA